MNPVLVKTIAYLLPIPTSNWKKKLSVDYHQSRLALVKKYLYGLNGIEIGASGKNFGLDTQKGSYANIDIIDAETRARNKGWKKSQLVNILASGDDLPFKDNTLDYVFTSHVIEHFFDPIKAIKEWFRVVKPGGYLFLIVPHKRKTFDRNRPITEVDELIARNNGLLSYTDYAKRTPAEKHRLETKQDKDHHIQITDVGIPEGWEPFESYDFEHHWSVWDTEAFIRLCVLMNWELVESRDVDEKVGNEFKIILRKGH